VSLALRAATPADAAAIAELVTAHDAEYHGTSDPFAEQDVLDWWRRIDDGDAVVVTGEGGRLAGTCALRRRGDTAVADNFTSPDLRGRGVGSLLLDWAETRAAEKGVVSLRVAVAASDRAARAMLEQRGFGYVRSFYRMMIELDRPPPAPLWPDGFTVAAMQPGEERLVHEAVQDAFLDHWDFQTRSFEEWLAHADIDPSLCFLVRDREGTVVASEFGKEERFGVGWIDVLGVRRPWRRHGLGESLLRLAFRELYARGRRRVGLAVDAANPTGATRLYERVGMTVAAQEDAYEKALGPSG
jgi:mycothiol synthase